MGKKAKSHHQKMPRFFAQTIYTYHLLSIINLLIFVCVKNNTESSRRVYKKEKKNRVAALNPCETIGTAAGCHGNHIRD